ncbi:nucleotidyltransferase domain-containing protein [Vallitalea okinawensis]|uniref:nucleotidyltransferase domain-containing protein n=1 Tax=Vallitalea okinawensis TaxID=2078660 RepID=UPI000CFC5130|nr:nucleotidyltransferase domain-containing protein [Vallitalea okinawensis]
MKNSIQIMKEAIVDILGNNISAIYLFGSVALGDFKSGWSDIDILCLTKFPIADKQANTLVSLRQSLLEKDQENQYFRLFEGGIISLNTFMNGTTETVIYWGTSGQRITDTYHFDSFSMYELISDGVLLYGNDIRAKLTMPTYEQLKEDVVRHYEAIRKYAVNTSRSIYSVGWLLDIARGIYTLQTGKVIAKTKAGEWALEKQICPIPETLSKAVQIRKNPQDYLNDNTFWDWTETLGDEIQKFADVMEDEIKLAK